MPRGRVARVNMGSFPARCLVFCRQKFVICCHKAKQITFGPNPMSASGPLRPRQRTDDGRVASRLLLQCVVDFRFASLIAPEYRFGNGMRFALAMELLSTQKGIPLILGCKTTFSSTWIFLLLRRSLPLQGRIAVTHTTAPHLRVCAPDVRPRPVFICWRFKCGPGRGVGDGTAGATSTRQGGTPCRRAIS